MWRDHARHGRRPQGACGRRRARQELRRAGDLYFHGSEPLPILIFAVFTKNDKANLSDTEENNLAKLTQAIKARAK